MRILARSSSIRRAFSRMVEASIASVCSSSRLPAERSAGLKRESMYSSPTVASAAVLMRVSSDDPLRICTSGRQTTLRSSSAATLISGRTPCCSSGSKLIESRSRRECSARWITEVGTRRSSAGSGCPSLSRATATSRSPPCAASEIRARSRSRRAPRPPRL